MTDQSRRFVVRSLCGCALGISSGSLLARVLPTDLTALVTPDYRPLDTDEQGLWQSVERLEQELAISNLIVNDTVLKSYLGSVVSRLLGDDLAFDLRIYSVRNPDFNASMFPNGMMLVNTGLLVRMLNEAQLAAVIGHECGHYLRRHSLQNWRSNRIKLALMNTVAIGGGVATVATGTNWYDIANSINSSLLSSMFSFSRALEREADAFGLQLLRDSGYDLKAASEVWSLLIGERKASAAARKKRYRDDAVSEFSTHPPGAERMTDLAATAAYIKERSSSLQYADRRAEWQAAIGGLRQSLIEEQIRLNDPGASLHLLNNLAQGTWDGVLRYFEGETYNLRDETGDAQLAARAYAAAVQYPDVPAEGFRAHGYAQLKGGNVEDGRSALTRYLELRPDAPDVAMVRFTLRQ